jgi:RNA polymerase sigma-70 factor (sigma-E family)
MTDQPAPIVSFETYVGTRSDSLVRLAYLMVRDRHLAEDLVQESLARLHRSWSRVQASDNPDAYVRRTMLNQLLSWRRRRSWTERSVADPEPANAALDPSTQTVERDAMWQLLGTLPTRQRAVVVLRFYEDLDDNAIADLLDCAPATVRSHVSKALAQLRSSMTDAALTREGSQ